MSEPPVKFWVMGANEWRYADDWPLPETQWTPLYLKSWGRLQSQEFVRSSAGEDQAPDAFVQMPLTQTVEVQKLRYMTEPLPHDVLVAGPAVLNLFAADRPGRHQLDRQSEGCRARSVGSDRERGRTIHFPSVCREREVSRGWLKSVASRGGPRSARSPAGRGIL
jgi:Predicted acyl esterases